MNPTLGVSTRRLNSWLSDIRLFMNLLTTNEVAEKLGVHVTRVHQLIKDGRLPAQKKGRDWFIKEEDLKLVEVRKVGRPPVISKKKAEKGTTKSKKGGAIK